MILNPLRLKDYVTLGNILGGVASMIASIEGSPEWAALCMLIAWVFDSFDGAVAKLTGGGNKFGEVFDNLADLIAYSLAPTFLLYLMFRMPVESGGAGWPIWAAGAVAAIPTVFGCIRFTRNNVKEFTFREYHLGLPRTVHAQFIASLMCSHLFRNAGITDPASLYNPVAYGLAAGFVAVTSLMILTLRPFHKRPRRGAPLWVKIFTTAFLGTSGLALVVALVLRDLRLFFDMMTVSYALYTGLNWLIIPRSERAEARAWMGTVTAEWREEQRPGARSASPS
jgi:CDP-diacylglycerol--serine O-phosphatidyltransferase